MSIPDLLARLPGMNANVRSKCSRPARRGRFLCGALLVLLTGCAGGAPSGGRSSAPAVQGGSARAGDLDVHYEVRGAGTARPLVMLHGALMTNDAWGELLPALARTRQVVAIEQQAHGCTPDVNRPLSYEQMADDTAAVLRHLGIERADVLGYSMGGGVALQLAIRHPACVGRLIVMSAPYRSDGWHPDVLAAAAQLEAQMLVDTPWHESYVRRAARPDWDRLVARVKELDGRPYAWSEAAVRAIAAPTFVIAGDADGVRLEHAVELFRLRGGGVFGDVHGVPAARLAVLPGTTHTGILANVDLLASLVVAFLDSP